MAAYFTPPRRWTSNPTTPGDSPRRTTPERSSIQVKTKTAGSWHANAARDAHPRDEDPTEEKFWIFVDLGPAHPDYYIAPAWWVENDNHAHHAAYLAKHGGKRAHGGSSQHHAIMVKRLLQWEDRWDVLGILPSG